jgi:hypothetical protein
MTGHAKRRQGQWGLKEFVILALFISLVLAVLGAICGCTFAPKPVAAKVVPLSGNSQNGGILGRLPSGAYVVTAEAVAKYNSLIAAGFGKGFIPPALQGDGVAPLADGTYHLEVAKNVFGDVPCVGCFTLDAEHSALFGRMATAYRSGTKP